MRILKLTSGNDGGGVFICETNFAKEWIKNDIALDYLIVGDGSARETYESFAHKTYFASELPAQFTGSPLEILKNSYLIQRHAKKTARLLRNTLTKKYDAIIYQWPTFIHLAAAINKHLDAPIFWHMPNTVNRKFAVAYYNAYSLLSNVNPIANSRHTQRSIGPISKHVIYPGYDETRTAAYGSSLRSKLDIPSDAIVFGSAARLHPDKGADIIIKAIAKAGLFAQNVHCLIAGGPLDSPYGEEIKALAKEYPDQVHLLGHIANLPDFYATLDLFVHCGRRPEAFGISVAEAMASSLPIIAYQLGGPAEMIDHGKNGWLVDDPTVSAYSRTFLLAYHQRLRWTEMARRSSLSAHNFGASTNAQKFRTLIDGMPPTSL